MKPIIHNFLVPNTKRFLSMIEGTLPKGIDKIVLNDFDFRRYSGYGSYEILLGFDLYVKDSEGQTQHEIIHLTHYTNDSVMFDNYQDMGYNSKPYNDFVKRWTLRILESDKNQEKLMQEINKIKDL